MEKVSATRKKILIGIIALIVIGLAYFFAAQYSEHGYLGAPGSANSDMFLEQGAFEVEVQTVEYSAGVTGFLARPARSGSYPGVIMVHEWWGLNENIESMAKTLASQGYTVLAVDLFGTVASTPDQARSQVSSVDQSQANSNMLDAAEYLQSVEGVSSLGVLGWCFGGGQALQLSLTGLDLDATVIYYGSLVTDQEMLSVIDWPVLGVFGEEDSSIPVERVREFEAALNSLGIENEVHVYPGVGHAFANPSGSNYAPEPTRDAWEKTLAFLEAHLKA